ncbi:hypothetical protein BD289DRAFT_421816 [Coniella lustricola]|uniref:Uncharacterized protein n=1 Tax=Coniella lustricola TaxID=2025994 RepID=A0A2T3AL01_9PEZI|nr:hypothetical protein BD289DRAFT_421816 [Coniella lustricola]
MGVQLLYMVVVMVVSSLRVFVSLGHSTWTRKRPRPIAVLSRCVARESPQASCSRIHSAQVLPTTQRVEVT